MIWSNFATNIYGRSFTKKLISGTRKMENEFSVHRNENFLRQHCLPFQGAPFCTIWDHLNKLCHECGHKIDHLAWKPWIFTLDNSFLRTLFWKLLPYCKFIIFPGNLDTYNDTMRRFYNFLIFWILYAHFKMRSKRREWPFLASGWILEFFWCFSD